MIKFYLGITAIFMLSLCVNAQTTNLLPIQQEAWNSLYENCNGENWTIKTVDELVKRTQSPFILLDNTGTTGEDGKNYDYFETFDLSNNNLTGALPSKLVINKDYKQESIFPAVAQYTKLYFSHNEITEVPDGIGYGGFRFLYELKLDNNKISKFHVSQYEDIFTINYGYNVGSGIYIMELQQNEITKLTKDDLGTYYGTYPMIHNKAEHVRLDNNRLTFESLVDLVPFLDNHTDDYGVGQEGNPDFYVDYAPQKAIGDAVAELSGNKDSAHELSFALTHKDNVYSWQLNGKDVPLSESKKFNIKLSKETAGVYRCKITNPNLPALTLYSKDRAIFLNKEGNKSITDFKLIHDAITENFPEGAIVADFQGTDPDGDEVYYRLVEGEADNSSFRIINGKTLISSEILFNRHYLSEYKLKIEAYDIYGGKLVKDFTISKGEGGDTQLPDDITLSAFEVKENVANAKIGKLVAVGVDGYSFSLTNSSDQALFYIENDSLKTKIGLDYESKKEHSVRITAKAEDGTQMKKDFIVKVKDANDAPYTMLLTGTSILINKPSGNLIGVIVAADQDPSDIAFSYELVEGNGDNHNADFVIQNNQLFNGKSFTNEDLGEKSIRVKVSDDEGASFEEVFKISVISEETSNEFPRGFGLSNNCIWKEFKTDQTIAYLFLSDPEGNAGTFTTESENISINGNEIKLVNRPANAQFMDITIIASDGENEIESEFRFYIESEAAANITAPNSLNYSVYPNPTSSDLYVGETGDISIYSLAGILLLKESNTNKINVSSLEDGTYIVRLKLDGTVYTNKFVKQQ